METEDVLDNPYSPPTQHESVVIADNDGSFVKIAKFIAILAVFPPFPIGWRTIADIYQVRKPDNIFTLLVFPSVVALALLYYLLVRVGDKQQFEMKWLLFIAKPIVVVCALENLFLLLIGVYFWINPFTGPG
jgi:hypothetical protein